MIKKAIPREGEGKEMKKLIIILAFALSVALLLFAGCGSSVSSGDDSSDTQTTTDEGTGNENAGSNDNKEEITEMYIKVNGNKLKVTLAENSTVDALVKILKQGDITYTAHANNFEIYGDIGHRLPTNNSQMTSAVGDVFLWAGDNICIFFGNNSYSYTKIGRIEGYTSSELKAILAPSGNVQVTLSLQL